jgi:serine/threonine protein kinase
VCFCACVRARLYFFHILKKTDQGIPSKQKNQKTKRTKLHLGKKGTNMSSGLVKINSSTNVVHQHTLKDKLTSSFRTSKQKLLATDEAKNNSKAVETQSQRQQKQQQSTQKQEEEEKQKCYFSSVIDNSHPPDFSKLNISSFEKIRLLGKGDVGKVYLVHVKNAPYNQQVYAMKILEKEEMIQRKKVQRVITENSILSITKYPLIVTMYCSFQDEENLYFIMEYCAGGEFFHMLKKQPNSRLPEQSVKFYAAEVLLALEYLHHIGVIYRDLKPENILVHESGHIRLADFDLSKLSDVQDLDYIERSSSVQKKKNIHQLFNKIFHRKDKKEKTKKCKKIQQLTSFVGTAEYIAPEVITGFGYSAAVDWWTLGILIYEMLYGRTPFRGEDQDSTFKNILQHKLQFPEISTPVSDECKDLITKLLNPDQNQRLGSKQGASEIKAHPWFADIDWKNLPYLKPPIIPQVRDVMDFSNFAALSDSEDEDEEEEEEEEHIEKIYSVDENLDEIDKLMKAPEKKSRHHTPSKSLTDTSSIFKNFSYRPSTPPEQKRACV